MSLIVSEVAIPFAVHITSEGNAAPLNSTVPRRGRSLNKIPGLRLVQEAAKGRGKANVLRQIGKLVRAQFVDEVPRGGRASDANICLEVSIRTRRSRCTPSRTSS